jgi:hypothetical protein
MPSLGALGAPDPDPEEDEEDDVDEGAVTRDPL